MNGLPVTISILILLTTPGSCDYSCVCNYNVEKSVFATMSEQGNTVGYMYEFDCKQQLNVSQNQQGWFTIAFEHKIGYVKQDSQVQLQLCPGDPPPDDIVTTRQPHTSPHSLYISSQSTRLVKASTQIATSSTGTVLPSSLPTSVSSSATSTFSSIRATTTIPSSQTTASSSPHSTTSLTSDSTHSTTSLTSIKHPVLPTTVTFSLGETSLCAEKVRRFAQTYGGILAQFENICYVLIKQYRHWPQAELDCNAEGGHLVHMSNQAEQTYLYSFLWNHFNHSIWIGLNDKDSEAHFKWSSGQIFYFVNWANHTHFSDTIEDCVVMDMHLHDGKWDDRDCTFEVYPYICQYGLDGDNIEETTQTLPLNSSFSSDGSTQLCPPQVLRNVIGGTVLGQYERGCYELHLNNKMSWEHGENICQTNGGHLAHISNSQQQAFVEGFMQRHNPNHGVWLGLHDTITEGSFQWTAGNAVQFTNWIPGHHNNTLGGHGFEDCVVFVPQKQGYWDDVHCGFEEIFGRDSGEIHYALCQYKIHSSVAIVG